MIFWVDRKVPEGTTLEEFANRCFHEWGVGQKGKSNGVAFFLFTDDRKMRMEVGYGLEGAIPDARAHRIDSEIIAPLLKAGDVARGARRGRRRDLRGRARRALQGHRPDRGRDAHENPSAFWFFLPLLVPFVRVLRRHRRLVDRDAPAADGGPRERERLVLVGLLVEAVPDRLVLLVRLLVLRLVLLVRLLGRRRRQRGRRLE